MANSKLIKLVITDIDGVWTDGGMYYTAEGDVMKRFSVKDGWGVSFLHKAGIPVAILTGENTPIVQRRAEKLKIDYCFLGIKDKVAQAEALCAELGIGLGEVAFIGDDLNDLPLLRRVGFSASPVNTPDYVKREVDYVTRRLWRIPRVCGEIADGYGAVGQPYPRIRGSGMK